MHKPNYLRVVTDCMVPGCGWSKIASDFNQASGLWESHEKEKHAMDTNEDENNEV